MGDDKDAILAGLAPLFVRARREGLWFHCAYQDMWFSPDELAAEQAGGHFLWGAVNWTLRPPQDGLVRLERDIENAVAERDRFAARMGVPVAALDAVTGEEGR